MFVAPPPNVIFLGRFKRDLIHLLPLSQNISIFEFVLSQIILNLENIIKKLNIYSAQIPMIRSIIIYSFHTLLYVLDASVLSRNQVKLRIT